jgi:hypothetical protein
LIDTLAGIRTRDKNYLSISASQKNSRHLKIITSPPPQANSCVGSFTSGARRKRMQFEIKFCSFVFFFFDEDENLIPNLIYRASESSSPRRIMASLSVRFPAKEIRKFPRLCSAKILALIRYSFNKTLP